MDEQRDDLGRLVRPHRSPYCDCNLEPDPHSHRFTFTDANHVAIAIADTLIHANRYGYA